MAARVAILAPFTPPSVRGNAVTVARIARGLSERGVALRVWDLSVREEAAVAAEVEAYRPALVHAFHAHHPPKISTRTAAALMPDVCTCRLFRFTHLMARCSCVSGAAETGWFSR